MVAPEPGSPAAGASPWLGPLAASLLLGAAGLTISFGMALLLVAILAWHHARPGGTAAVALALSVGVLLGFSLQAGGAVAGATTAGVLALWWAAPPREPPGLAIPWGVAAAAGAVGAGWMLLPGALPMANLVMPRPVAQTLPAAGLMLLCPLVAAGASRLNLRGPPRAGLSLASALALGLATYAAWSPWPAGLSAQRARALAARHLGLQRLEADLVARGLEEALTRGEPQQAWDWYRQATREEDQTRHDGRVLLAAAQALQAVGGPPSTVDALLVRALKTGPLQALRPALQRWPGPQATQQAAQRAGPKVARQLWPQATLPQRLPAVDCFGGVWCLLAADLLDGVAPDGTAQLELRWQKVAPSVGPVDVELVLDWEGWKVVAPLPDDNAAPGVVVTHLVVLDAARQHRPAVQIHLWLRPRDGGAPLTLATLPGASVDLGTFSLPPPGRP